MMIYIGGHWPKQWAGLAWPNSYWWEFCHFVCLCLCLCLSMSLSFYVFVFLCFCLFSFSPGDKMISSCNDDGKAVRHPSSDQTSKSHCPNKDNATKIASPASFPIWKIPKIKKHLFLQSISISRLPRCVLAVDLSYSQVMMTMAITMTMTMMKIFMY